MSTTLVVVFSLALAGGLAWLLDRFEKSREPAPTVGSRVLDEVFAPGAGTTDDAVLLTRLLTHRRECIGDAVYVDQARRLMLAVQQIDQARALLKDAEWHNTFKPDELKAQVVWVDLTAAHLAWVNGNEAAANALRSKAVAAANELRQKWPEWSLPYRLLEEAARGGGAPTTTEPTIDYYQLEKSVRGRVWNGAWVRSLLDWRPIVFVFGVTGIGLLSLCAAISGWLALREMAHITTSPIGTASAGYVELKGTLHVLPNPGAVVSPYSKTPAVWYEMDSRSGAKGSRTTTERSAQPFLIRDASGEAVIEPQGITVRTRHVTGTDGSGGGFTSGGHVTERVLKEDDAAYVLGELKIATSVRGPTVRTLHVAEDGRRLLVSNFNEEQLRFFEQLWLCVGVGFFCVSVLVLVWSYYQRYYVQAVPGVLQ